VLSTREAIRGLDPADPFLVLWHRAGNDVAGIRAAARVARDGRLTLAGRPLRHGVECDLKWAEDAAQGGAPFLYLWHGPTGRERHSLEEARRRAGDGRVLALDDALALPEAQELDFMVEVKAGHGSQDRALQATGEAFRAKGLAHRLLFAASSLPILEDARRLVPDAATLLFATHVTAGGRALHVPKVDVLRGLRRGLLVGRQDLGAVDALSPLGPFGRARTLGAGGPASIPRAGSWDEAEGYAKAGLRGAFTYWEPG